MSDLDEIRRIIHSIENAEPVRNSFIEGRYPYTYAYDYVRSHQRQFGIPGEMRSRADVSAMYRDSPDKEAIVRLLADAYCREHNIWNPHNPEGDTA